MKKFSAIILLSLLTSGSTIGFVASDVPDFMQPFVVEKDSPVSKESIALDNVYVLNEDMFTIYDRSLEIYRKNFLDRHHLIMGLFSGKGGRFILYRPGQPPLEAKPVPWVYQVAKSVGHCAMATFQLLAPYTADPSADLAWLGSLKSYQTNVQTSIDALDAIDLETEVRELLRDTLKQIAAFMDTIIQNRTYTYQEIQSFARTIKPNLAKLIDVATNAQVKHWWKVLDEWKKMIGEDWENTYALSNSIYVARQNNILFSILVQFFGEKVINDRLLLLETTDFTTTPDLMMNAFMRVVSDRMIGEVFYKNRRLMDFELLGGSARKVIEAEAASHGLKAILPPRVPFNSHEWPWKIDPHSGTGPVSMEEIH
jgi:hypothetical protein